MDPQVVVSNSGSNSVTLIDAVTSSVQATVSVPSGSNPTAVATSPANRFALVVDPGTGKVSIINLQTNVDQGELSLTASANVLSSIAFSSSGAYAYVTDPSQHKIFVINHTPGTSPYYSVGTTYTNASYNFSGIATDLSTTSSSALLATDGVTGGHLLKFDDSAGTLSAPTVVRTFGTVNPGAVSLSPGGATAYVIAVGSKVVQEVTVSSGADTGVTTNSAFTAVGALGLSADGATLLSADSATSNVQGTNTVANTATNETSTDAVVTAIAPALASSGGWDLYALHGTSLDVINSATSSITQTITISATGKALAASPDGQWMYAAVPTGVDVIQTSDVGTGTNPDVATITVAQGPSPTRRASRASPSAPRGTRSWSSTRATALPTSSTRTPLTARAIAPSSPRSASVAPATARPTRRSGSRWARTAASPTSGSQGRPRVASRSCSSRQPRPGSPSSPTT
jgi:YVTN family beta-propeller protein